MSKWFVILLTSVLSIAGAEAQSSSASDQAASAMMQKMVNEPSVDDWSVLGVPQLAPQADTGLPGDRSIRIDVPDKGANPWDIQASAGITKPVKKGDVILVAFWARADLAAGENPAAVLTTIQFQESKPPFTNIFNDTAALSSKWTMYYASGVATEDYGPGSVNVTMFLATAKQTVYLGQIFIIDFGPDYDRSKLPRNKVAQAPASQTSSPGSVVTHADAEARFGGELARLRALLPVRGTLINDPGEFVNVYGSDQTNAPIEAADVPGGKAVRIGLFRSGSDPWSDGAGIPISAPVQKGDVIFMAVYTRAVQGNDQAQSGVISSIGLQLSREPWTAVATTPATVLSSAWRVFYIHGVADRNYPSGELSATFQIGCCKQTIDIGPVFILNLGSGVNLTALPSNRIGN